MPYSEQSIEYIRERKVLSGLDPDEIESCVKSGFDINFERWSYDAYEVMRASLSDIEMIEVLNSMDEYTNVGDFICDEIAQRIEFAAYLLILLDRFAKMASESFDSWKAFALYHQIYECDHYVSPPRFVLRGNAQKAASVRHTENREMKEEMFNWYCDYGKGLKNDAAAIRITELVPISLRTAQDWVSKFRKEIRSAGTT